MRDPADWMLSEAIEALARAERLHRQMFQPPSATRRPAWEPPVDVLETEHEVLVLIALPGVDPDQVEAVIEDGALVVAGRASPAAAAAHRRHPPAGAAAGPVRAAHPVAAGPLRRRPASAGDGCLIISLPQSAAEEPAA